MTGRLGKRTAQKRGERAFEPARTYLESESEGEGERVMEVEVHQVSDVKREGNNSRESVIGQMDEGLQGKTGRQRRASGAPR